MATIEEIDAEIARRERLSAIDAEIARRTQQPQQEPTSLQQAGQALAQAPANQLGVLENIAAIASGAIAEPIAGVAGLTQAINPFADPGAGAQAVQGVREALTFQPRTEAGQAQQQVLGQGAQAVSEFVNRNVLAPNLASLPFVGSENAAERFEAIAQGGTGAAGQAVLEATDSPLLATLTEILPTAGAEIIGGKKALSSVRNPRLAARNIIAKEIEDGNINAGNIAKTLDAQGELITNPNLKKAIKLMGDSDAAYSSAINFEKMNDATRFQVNKMLDTIQSNKSSGDPTQIMENRPANIIGRSLANRVKKLDSIKKEASSSIGKIINSDVGQKQINTNSIRDNFINALRESDIDVGLDADGNLIADTSRTLANTGEVLSDAKLNNILKRLQSGNMTAKDAHKLKRNVRELVSFDATAPGAVKVSAEIENTIKGLSSELNDEIGVISSAYKRANQKFSDSIDTLKEVDRMLGKRLMVGDELAENKLGALSKRIGTNLASREDVLAMVDSLDTSLNKRKVFPKDNIKQQVATLADLEKIFKVEGEQSPFGFQSRIAQGLTEGAQLATGAPASTQLIDAAITKFRSMNKLEFDDKMKALRALSKKRGK